MAKTKIEWTQNVWNPLRGCTRVSDGCRNCYAEGIAARFSGPGQPFEGIAEMRGGKGRWTGKLAFVEAKLTEPLRVRRPTTWFVNSMSDLFHEAVPDAWIDRVFAVMALCPQHTFQCLTKRSARMRAYLSNPSLGLRVGGELMRAACGHAAAEVHVIGLTHRLSVEGLPLSNLWLGVSTEDQRRADERIPDLLATPAAVRFVSAEPLLGPIDLRTIDVSGNAEVLPLGAAWLDRLNHGETEQSRLDWIIVGGESGPNARPMHSPWPRDIRDQCASAGVAYLFKQHGAWIGVPDLRRLPGGTGPGFGVFDHCRHDMDADAVLVGKKAAGRLLDGVEHNGMPEVRHG